MYSRGMALRETQTFLAEHYGSAVSPDFISPVTDAVLSELRAWQARALGAAYLPPRGRPASCT